MDDGMEEIMHYLFEEHDNIGTSESSVQSRADHDARMHQLHERLRDPQVMLAIARLLGI